MLELREKRRYVSDGRENGSNVLDRLEAPQQSGKLWIDGKEVYRNGLPAIQMLDQAERLDRLTAENAERGSDDADANGGSVVLEADVGSGQVAIWCDGGGERPLRISIKISPRIWVWCKKRWPIRRSAAWMD